MTEYEKLLADILNEEEGDVVPKSRVEAYLLALYEKVGTGSGGGGGGSGLPTIEVTEDILAEGGGTLPEDTCDVLNGSSESRMPVIIKIHVPSEGMAVSAVLSYVYLQQPEDIFLTMYVGSLSLYGEVLEVTIMKGFGSESWAITI